MNTSYTKTSTLRLIYSIISIIILSVAVLPGSAAEYENQQQYHAYATSTSITSALPGIINFNFAAAGDWGCSSHTTDTVNNILDKNPELVLGLGDYAYYGRNANCWFDDIRPIDNIMKIAIGNHDVKGTKLAQYMEHFGLTSQYYSFDYQNVHFTVMSDYVADEIGSEQYIFVQNDLAKAAADPNIDWIVIVHHDQQYASTAHKLLSRANKWKEAYHPLFEQYNVDLVLQGHQHNYQRTYPIKYNIDTPINPIITDRNRNTYINPEGQIFATVGTGGAFLQHLNGNKAPYLTTAQDEVYGFLNVDITNNNNDGTTTLVSTFYSNDGGEMTDQFTIAKSAEGNLSLPPPPPIPPPIDTDTDDGDTDTDDGDGGDGGDGDGGDGGDGDGGDGGDGDN